MTVEKSLPFAGKKVFITGAGRDFGRTLAINFARLGADLLLSARNIENARATKTIIRSTLPAANIACFQIDLTDDRQLAGARDEIEGFTDRIDILIHNAGFWLKNDLVDTPDDDIVKAVASTATGPFILTKHLLPLINRSSAADVVFLNGTTALRNNLRAINEAFSAAKAAQALFSERLRHR
ncbi:MAG: SDR family NAD(P)-dependent oxidoreductase, partial [Alphaproteobacteria bacterium]